MLQPKEVLLSLAIFTILAHGSTGLDRINSTPRRLQQNREDVTTVLLVDNNGRSPYGRFLNVKPDVGLITSTARTFVQEGVTTEYATQVVGTTLDDGRLYAHLLTKTSRVIYNGDGKPFELNTKKISIDQSRFGSDHFIKNTDYIFPSKVEAHTIFATTDPSQYSHDNHIRKEFSSDDTSKESLKESSSNDIRITSEQNGNHKLVFPEKIRVFKINSQNKDEKENLILHREDEDPLSYNPSKVKEWDNLPTFTVRNEFSPSGFSYLGDLPEFDSKTERNKYRIPNDRRAKNLFLAGLLKPSIKELKTTTYTGFADFTTTVGDTVIIFTPHTSEVPKLNQKSVTKVTVEPTIKPTANIFRPVFEVKSVTPLVETNIKDPFTEDERISLVQSTPEMKNTITFTEATTDPPNTESSPSEDSLETESVPSTTESDDEIINRYSSMVIDKNNRQKYGKSQNFEESFDMEAKSSVLAREQQSDTLESSEIMNSLPSVDVLEPSERQTPMLSTPSHEDIAKIFASLQAQEYKATDPLNTAATIFFDSKEDLQDDKPSGGATTIFFNDDLPILKEASNTPTLPSIESVTVPESITKPSIEISTENHQEITSEEPTISTDDQITSTEEVFSTTEYENMTEDPSDEENLISETKQTTEEEVEKCKDGIKIIPSTIYKTLTYLTTFFIPIDGSTSTSIKANEVVSSEVKRETALCSENQVSATKVMSDNMDSSTSITTTEQEFETTEPITSEYIQTTEQETTVEEQSAPPTTTEELQTTPQEITTERRHVTESEPITTEETTEDGEEIELIFKTLYTTYTYLTTYFQETTSSVASRIVVTTNVVTSTLDPASQSSDAVSGLFESFTDVDTSYKSRPASFEDFEEISPSQLEPNLFSTTSDHNDDLESTPSLDNEILGIKTYYTTYTYFTTIFVDDETEVSSRTEVYTNYVTPSIEPTKTDTLSISTLAVDIDEEDDEHYKEKYDTTISRNITSKSAPEEKNTELQHIQQTVKNGYVTLLRTTTENVPIEDNLLHLSNESISTMVKSTTSNGERRLLNNVDKRNVLDDQIVSESNNESEIIPSPTLLLQTSYTTFTYFTTMYQGTTGSNVVSRLETVTNIVTETLTPSHTLSLDDLSLPITYFTTFTYWTTLYKQGTTKVTSREETISNVVTPTPSVENSESTTIEFTPTVVTTPVSSSVSSIEPTSVDDDLLTTVYTTYTYYTTSYVGDETVINSRLETVTTMLNKTEDIESNQITNTSETFLNTSDVNRETEFPSEPELKPTGLLSTIVNTEENSGTTTILSTDIFGTYIDGLYAKILESTSSIITESITPTTLLENLKPTGIVSINKGQIVDAEGISTLFYTTQAVGTYIDNLYAQVIESTSSLKVDEKKKELQTDIPVAKKTGLVRLVQGSIVQNSTTTLYQSKVIGTIIDGRYAQVIESTSSFLKDNVLPTSTTEVISPTSTLPPDEGIKATSVTISPSSAVIESSLSETLRPEDDVKEDDISVNTKSKPNFQPKKKTFTPGIRPFVQRPKSSYTPKRRLPGGTSATTVTRNDFTPTVTAIPASRGKFGNRRNSASINPTSSNSRKFSRSKSSSFGGRRSSSRIQPSSTGFGSSSRRGGFRSSSPGAILRSSGFPGNSAKFRIRPTATSSLFKSSVYTSNTESIENEGESSGTTQINDDSENSENETTLQASTTTESNKRQNPLLKLLRTPLSRPPINGGRTSGSKNNRVNSINRNGKRTTTTTFKPKSTRSSPSFRGRPNALFPRRNLFTTSTTTTELPEEDEEAEDDETLIEENEEEEDNYFEGSQKRSVISKPPVNTGVTGINIRPFKFGKRTKRDTYSRFRRPTAKSTTSAPDDDYTDYEVPKPKPKNNRFTPRSRKPKTTASTTQTPTTSSRKGISPNKVKPHSRTQFTLRPEKEKSNFRRPSSQRSNSRIQNPRTTTSSPRTRARNSYNSYQTEASVNRKNSGKSNSRNSNRRPQSRQRAQTQDLNDNNVLPAFDGTITVTHQIPTEITIPVINGKITEYKNIVTAKLSTEIIGPAQYSTTLNPIGREVTVLLSESTNLANNGATLITQFVLNETPTTSVTFTPTYIRNRKTSYSHIVPSTIYAVEQVVNTIQPALAAQAPLANILLSQLLLGGLQPQNPLLALQNPGVNPTPTTEFKTRTTTYVTTVTSSTSTVIPLTFRGKEILTTIVDSSVNVITATEFLTDTIVVTPTAGFPVGASPQLNTLLLPLLQQQLSQPVPQFIPKNDNPNLELFQDASLNEPDEFNLALDEDEDEEESPVFETKPKVNKGIKKPKKNVRVEQPKETSVITLYVSGKTPGEFSTVLSTIIQDPRDRQKRESGEEIRPSRIVQDSLVSTQDYLDTFILPGRKELLNLSPEAYSATESLESILGDVSKHSINTSTSKLVVKPTRINDFTKEFGVDRVQSSDKKILNNFLA